MPALLSNISNPILESTIVASSVRAALSTVRPRITSRQGMGRVLISGGYTGFDDAKLDIEVMGASGATLRVSEPVFIGSGTGSITDISASAGATVEEIDITLSDLGTVTKLATLDFFGVTLQSRLNGADGNQIYLSVDTSHIVKSDTTWSTIEDIAKDTLELKGPQWTFGSLPLMGDGTLNPNTVRFTFGDDPTIYREYSIFENNETVFKLDKKLVSDVKSGTPLKSVTGYYVVTVTDGTTTETYSNIVTLYDFLSKVKSTSNLLKVDGVVVDDKAPGGMAMDEFPLRTGAYTLASTTTSEVGGSLQSVSVTSDCPGQLLEIKCKNNDVVGAEKWTVTAPSEGGVIGEAISGVAFSSAHFGFTVPKYIPENPSSVGMEIKLKSISLKSAGEEARDMQICLRDAMCGINAKAMTFDCVWTKAPSGKCNCENEPYEGEPNEGCLGIEIDDALLEGTMDADLKTALTALWNWKKAFDRANTALASGGLRSASYDLALSSRITDIFYKGIIKAYADASALAQWNTDLSTMQSDITTLSGMQGVGGLSVATPGVTYTEGDFVVPPAHQWTGHKYVVSAASTMALIGSGATDSAKLGFDLPTEWPTDGSDTGSIRYDVFDPPESYTYFLNFKDVGPIGDVDILYNSDSGAIRSSINEFCRRYESAMEYVQVLAGIDPKGEASGQGNECWQPQEADFFWKVGDDYLPAYQNKYYHSCKGKLDGTDVECTKEFGFAIVTTCPLVEGDIVTIEITGENTGNKGYQIGDTFNLPIIAGAPVYLVGGIDGNDTQTWSVRGSVSGALTPLSFTGDTSADYNLHNLHFKVGKGAVPFALNDQFIFSVEGGQFRYRFNSGSWSASQDIPSSATVSLGNGLSAEFASGVDPSFVSGDIFSYDVLQPYSPSNTLKPGYRLYEYTGAGCTLTFDFGTSTPVDGFAVGTHQLPSTATLVLQGLDGSNAVLWTENLTWSAGVISTLFDTKSAHKLKLTVSNATGGKIGWIWSGDPLRFRNTPSEVILSRNWKTSNSRYLGSGAGCELTWDGSSSWLYQDEVNDLIDVLNYSKSNNDQPLVLIPNEALYYDSRLVRFNSDSIELSEWFKFQVEDDSDDEYRIIGTKTLPFTGVIA